ncbi:hypothetical protein H0H92_014412 [Tricholoma furcatifolium]|nr:hypothetical protein H0H92_014412 [Tricholoma furcatifolium]
MSSRPQSWVQEEGLPFDHSYRTPESRSESPHERQRMLAGEVPQPTRPFDNIGRSASHSRLDAMNSSHAQDSSAESSSSMAAEGGSAYKIPRSASYKGIPSSPLNPAFPSGPPAPHFSSPFSRPGSRGNAAQIMRVPSEETRALSQPSAKAPMSTRGSMILYRKADISDELVPPPPHGKRNSTLSIDSVSLSSDSKYPVGMMSERRLVAYAWDPFEDGDDPDDKLHSPDAKMLHDNGNSVSLQGCINITTIILLIGGLLTLFVMYPVYKFYTDNGANALIVGNTRINSTGQAVDSIYDARDQIPLFTFSVIDPTTPQEAYTRVSKDGVLYHLIFSDEFSADDRSFRKGDDAVWETVNDSPDAVTRSGYLFLKSDSSLLQRSPVCLEGGFIDMSVVPSSANSADRLIVSSHSILNTLRRAYVGSQWTGSWNNVEADLPSEGTSLSRTSSLQLSIHSGSYFSAL